MIVLLTGASSFTGLWFAESLAALGFRVVAPLQRFLKEYDGLRRIRVERLAKVAELIEACPFGSDAFLGVMRTRNIDVLCHHAADVTNYKSPDFDVQKAVAKNTYNLPEVLTATSTLRAVVLTGSVFEVDEGHKEKQESYTPYGLSKTLTSNVFQQATHGHNLPLTRFIIPYPFGPYEEPRFCHYLLSCWAKGQKAVVKTPDYLRDNIHVSLLASVYADGVRRIHQGERIKHLAPSGYVETQGAFAKRMASELAPRLNLACEIECVAQTEFLEPPICVNGDKVDLAALGWDEKINWENLAAYYRAAYFIGA